MKKIKIDYMEILKFILTLVKYYFIFIGMFLWLGIEIIGGFGEGMFLGSLFDE